MHFGSANQDCSLQITNPSSIFSALAMCVLSCWQSTNAQPVFLTFWFHKIVPLTKNCFAPGPWPQKDEQDAPATMLSRPQTVKTIRSIFVALLCEKQISWPAQTLGPAKPHSTATPSLFRLSHCQISNPHVLTANDRPVFLTPENII